MPDDKLLGDLTAEKLKQLRLDRLARRIAKVTGKPCGCAKRKEQLNNLHTRLKR